MEVVDVGIVSEIVVATWINENRLLFIIRDRDNIFSLKIVNECDSGFVLLHPVVILFVDGSCLCQDKVMQIVVCLLSVVGC